MNHPISYKFKCRELGDAFLKLSNKYAHPDSIEHTELEDMGVPKETADKALMLLVDHVITEDGFAAWMRWMHLMAEQGL
jgi:hypothetical protein